MATKKRNGADTDLYRATNRSALAQERMVKELRKIRKVLERLCIAVEPAKPEAPTEGASHEETRQEG